MLNFVDLDEYLKQLAVYLEMYKESKDLQVLNFWDTTIRLAMRMAENHLNKIQDPISYYAVAGKDVPELYVAEYRTLKDHMYRMESWLQEISLNMYGTEQLRRDTNGKQ